MEKRGALFSRRAAGGAAWLPWPRLSLARQADGKRQENARKEEAADEEREEVESAWASMHFAALLQSSRGLPSACVQQRGGDATAGQAGAIPETQAPPWRRAPVLTSRARTLFLSSPYLHQPREPLIGFELLRNRGRPREFQLGELDLGLAVADSRGDLAPGAPLLDGLCIREERQSGLRNERAREEREQARFVFPRGATLRQRKSRTRPARPWVK